MGIQILSVPTGIMSDKASPLALPSAFDSKLYAAKWVKIGPAVAAAGEREWLVGTNYTADGWTVWRDPETKKPHRVSLSSGAHTLLFRPLEVQKAVNAIYGNLGKTRMLQERAGETVAGQAPDDSGMLNDDHLTKVLGREETEDGAVVMNPVETAGSRVEPTVAQTVAGTRSRPRRTP